MHPEDIKAELRKRKNSMAAVGRTLGVSTQAVAQTVSGLHRSRRIEAEIARRLELTPTDLWPDRYPTQPSQVHHEH